MAQKQKIKQIRLYYAFCPLLAILQEHGWCHQTGKFSYSSLSSLRQMSSRNTLVYFLEIYSSGHCWSMNPGSFIPNTTSTLIPGTELTGQLPKSLILGNSFKHRSLEGWKYWVSCINAHFFMLILILVTSKGLQFVKSLWWMIFFNQKTTWKHFAGFWCSLEYQVSNGEFSCFPCSFEYHLFL